MKQRDRVPFILFLFAVVFLAFGYGIVAGMLNLPPAPALRALYGQALDFAQYWKNDLGLEANRHLVPAYARRRVRFAVLDPGAMGDGRLLVTGLTPERAALNSIIMYDRNGRELHTWPVDYRRLDPQGPDPENVFLHGVEMFEDGSVIVNFDDGYVLARIDACGNRMWVTRGKFHHVVSRAYDGTIWSWKDDILVQLNADTGATLREIAIKQDLLQRRAMQGILAIRTEESPDVPRFSPDRFHPNHVEVLSPAMAAAFPAFAPGDLLISLRSLNLVAVLDPESLEFKWWKIGPWHRQHAPHFTRRGTILIYNNNMNFGPSEIVEVDPLSDRVEVKFAGDDAHPFYSWRRGKHQLLDDGSLLITEAERGRAFMIGADGRLVWEYNNIYDAARNGVLAGVQYVPPGFFRKDAFDCAAPAHRDEAAQSRSNAFEQGGIQSTRFNPAISNRRPRTKRA